MRTTPPPKAAKVAERIRKRRHLLFTFLDDPALEATNNRAERAMRPAVIARKSGGNRTQRGKRTWEILASSPPHAINGVRTSSRPSALT